MYLPLLDECWTLKSQQENNVGVAKTIMLHWMSGHTRLDRIRKEVIRDKVGVDPIIEKKW